MPVGALKRPHAAPALLGAHAALDRRLAHDIASPVVVALSGGGDSLALLLLTKGWADRAGRRLIAVTVDHRLQAAGGEWAAWCARRCSRLGVEHLTVQWLGRKPSTGLPAAARHERHRLLADAARRCGASVILMGHTADDLAEGAAMRADGSSVPDPREWSPSPAWPEGRGVFLLRPLLAARRADIRAWLAMRGETWIEDPANTDARFARARARINLVPATTAPAAAGASPAVVLFSRVGGGPGGDVTLPRAALARDGARALLSAALVCASGGTRAPRGLRLDRLMGQLRAPGAVTAVLAGARVEADAGSVRIVRETGEFARRPAPPLELGPGATVWDGRFEITAAVAGLRVCSLRGLTGRLPAAQRSVLKSLPPACRRALPALVDEVGAVSCPILARDSRVAVHSLVLERLAAACGTIFDEVSIWRVAKPPEAS